MDDITTTTQQLIHILNGLQDRPVAALTIITISAFILVAFVVHKLSK